MPTVHVWLLFTDKLLAAAYWNYVTTWLRPSHSQRLNTAAPEPEKQRETEVTLSMTKSRDSVILPLCWIAAVLIINSEGQSSGSDRQTVRDS